MNTVIKKIILEYCQGNEHLEFDYADLDDMVDRIAQYKQLTLTDVGCSLPKVCTGCGTLSTKVIDKKYLACCPDNHYIKLEDYCKKSVYKLKLFNK